MVVRNVEADSTVVGIPGRVVHQSGVKVNPLAHSALPDAEASIIRNLMKRIDNLENQILSYQKFLPENLEATQDNTEWAGESQSLRDKEIIEYLGDQETQ